MKRTALFRTRGFTPGMALLALLATTTLGQQQGGAPSQAQSPEAPVSQAQRYFTDVELIDQDGKPLRFYSDLIKNRVVVINPMFTSCQGVCPPMSRNMEKIQEWLGDRLGKQVHLISMTVDPATDTPPALKAFATKYHARPGWYFITGKPENLEFAMRRLGQYVEQRDSHTNILLIGNDRTGLWKKAFGLARPEELIKIVESVLNDK